MGNREFDGDGASETRTCLLGKIDGTNVESFSTGPSSTGGTTDGEEDVAPPKSLGGAVVVRFVVFKSSSGIS